jgi:LysR family transcriptional activator of nhaA
MRNLKLNLIAGYASGAMLTVKVGVAMVVPKLLAHRVLAPVLEMTERIRLICHEAPLDLPLISPERMRL